MDYTIPTKPGKDDIKTLTDSKRLHEQWAWQLPSIPFVDINAGLPPMTLNVENHIKQIGKANLLDIGCGNGFLVTYLFKKGLLNKGVGIDISEEAIRYSTETAKNSNIPVDFFAIPIETFEIAILFDVITMFEVIEHVINVPLVLGKIKALLREGGVLIGSCPVGNVCDGEGHLHYFNDGDLDALLRPVFSSFRVEKHDVTGNGEWHYYFEGRL